MWNLSVEDTTNMSIWVQLITGAVSFQGVLYKLKTEDQVLTDVLKMETFVQFVELMFYIMYLRYLATTPRLNLYISNIS